jgi:hypothetical protein
VKAEWQELFNRFADGIQSEADDRELAVLVRTSAEARRDYRLFMELHATLNWDSSCLAQPIAPPPAGGGPQRLAAAILFALVLAGLSAAIAVLPGRRQAGPLAVITQTRFLIPNEDGEQLEPGQPLSGRRLAIRGGVVELRLRNGVVVVFEGPGQLDLIDDMSAILSDGNVVVRMPEGADGFRLRTPSTEVIDLGTEFAVGIRAGNVTDVQVYDGAVITSAGAQPPKRLEKGEAARFSPQPNAEAVPLAYRPERFVRSLPPDVGIPSGGQAAARTASEVRLYGRPQHGGITVHRAPATIAVDGRLDEWAAAPGFASTLDGNSACSEQVDGRMMFDERCLYIAAHVRDPFPLQNIIDPELDAGSGWRGGGVQVRVSTDRSMGWPARGNSSNYYIQRRIAPSADQEEWAKNPRLSHLTMWLHAPTQTPCLTIVHGALSSKLLANPAGYAGAFVPDADGQGYTMEYAIPWELLNAADNPPQSGDVLAAVWQVHWSDEAGRMQRQHMVEVRNPDEPLQIHVWERAATWGRAEYR